MTLDALFHAFLKSYAVYYDVRETPGDESPFDAEAVFSSSEAQYFLLKGITLSETRIAEYVYFAKRERLTLDGLLHLDSEAWQRGLAAANPGPGHKRSDVTLIVLAETAEENTKAQIARCRHAKTHHFGFWGFSHYRLTVIERATGAFLFNRHGTHLKTLMAEIWNEAKQPTKGRHTP